MEEGGGAPPPPFQVAIRCRHETSSERSQVTRAAQHHRTSRGAQTARGDQSEDAMAMLDATLSRCCVRCFPALGHVEVHDPDLFSIAVAMMGGKDVAATPSATVGGTPPIPIGPRRLFRADHVFDGSSTNETVYRQTVSPLVRAVLRGYNATCFAYGMTGAGKTFTMTGVGECADDNESAETLPSRERCLASEPRRAHWGICQLAVEQIFLETTQPLTAPSASTTPGRYHIKPQQGGVNRQREEEKTAAATASIYTVHASYLEVYNEQIKDLLLDPSKKSSSPPSSGAHANVTMDTGRWSHKGPRTNGGRGATTTATSSGTDNNTLLHIVEDPIRGVCVPGLTEMLVTNVDELQQLLRLGASHRTTASTASNVASSRSHAMLQILLRKHSLRTIGGGGGGGAEPYDSVITTGKLMLVDLAGSERESSFVTPRSTSFQSGNEVSAATSSSSSAWTPPSWDSKNTLQREIRHDRQREGSNINKSLLALGHCITALAMDAATHTSASAVAFSSSSSGQQPQRHIPFRNSKLTRLLQESLGGHAATLMIAVISPSNACYEETLATLKYAVKAQAIRLSRPAIQRNVTMVKGPYGGGGSVTNAIGGPIPQAAEDRSAVIVPLAGRVLWSPNPSGAPFSSDASTHRKVGVADEPPATMITTGRASDLDCTQRALNAMRVKLETEIESLKRQLSATAAAKAEPTPHAVRHPSTAPPLSIQAVGEGDAATAFGRDTTHLPEEHRRTTSAEYTSSLHHAYGAIAAAGLVPGSSRSSSAWPRDSSSSDTGSSPAARSPPRRRVDDVAAKHYLSTHRQTIDIDRNETPNVAAGARTHNVAGVSERPPPPEMSPLPAKANGSLGAAEVARNGHQQEQREEVNFDFNKIVPAERAWLDSLKLQLNHAAEAAFRSRDTAHGPASQAGVTPSSSAPLKASKQPWSLHPPGVDRVAPPAHANGPSLPSFSLASRSFLLSPSPAALTEHPVNSRQSGDAALRLMDRRGGLRSDGVEGGRLLFSPLWRAPETAAVRTDARSRRHDDDDGTNGIGLHAGPVSSACAAPVALQVARSFLQKHRDLAAWEKEEEEEWHQRGARRRTQNPTATTGVLFPSSSAASSPFPMPR